MRTPLVCWRRPALLLSAGLLLMAVQSPLPADSSKKGTITMDRIEYQGWKNNLKISNGDIELIATLDVGPRILSYRLTGGRNVFKEFADQLGTTGEADWIGRGGHRLWIGPEDLNALLCSRQRRRELQGGQRQSLPRAFHGGAGDG